MKLGNPLLPANPQSAYDSALNKHLYDFFRVLIQKVNAHANGEFSALDGATDIVPTAAGKQGDFVKKLTRTEAGAATSKYVIDGWEYVGTVWLERRYLTGN